MNCTLLGARMRFGIATVLVSLVLGVFDVQNARASAIDDAVASAERTLGNVSAGALVVVAPVSADQPVLKSVELTQRIAGAFARTLIESRIHDVPLSLVAARDAAARARASALVYVQVDLVHGELRVVVDKYPVERNRWRRLRDGLAPSAAHGFGHAVLDVELRTFLPSVPLEQWKVSRSRLDEPNALAVACGDLGGDGGNELVIVTDAKILIGRLRDGRFLREVGMSWAEYAPRVAAPLRQPIATAVIDGLANELYVGHTDRGGIRLTAAGVLVARFAGIPLALRSSEFALCAEAQPEWHAFAPEVRACLAPTTVLRERRTEEPKAPFMQLPVAVTLGRFDASALLASPGTNEFLLAAARDALGHVRAYRGTVVNTLDNIGSQLATADLDQDGEPELVYSADSGEDAISIVTVARDGIRKRLRLPAAAGIKALAVCPPEAHGQSAVVALVGSEVWLVH